MTEQELVDLLGALPGVAAVTASKEGGAPEVACGDRFFFYDPDGDTPADRRWPFATIVTKDYPGWDVASNLDRAGVYRLNLDVGRRRFEELFGFPAADFGARQDAFDFAASDRVLPHPTYAKQGWISIIVPGEATHEQLPALIGLAHQRARDRFQRRGESAGQENPGVRGD